MPKVNWRNTLNGRFVKAPRGLLTWLLKVFTVKEARK